MSSDATVAETSAFACPRCGTDVRERYYGPCGACRDQLGLQQRFRGGEVSAERFEPKMNVVPNHVATKE